MPYSAYHASTTNARSVLPLRLTSNRIDPGKEHTIRMQYHAGKLAFKRARQCERFAH